MVHSTEDWKNSFPMTSQSILPTSPLRPRYFIMAVLCVIVMIDVDRSGRATGSSTGCM